MENITERFAITQVGGGGWAVVHRETGEPYGYTVMEETAREFAERLEDEVCGCGQCDPFNPHGVA